MAIGSTLYPNANVSIAGTVSTNNGTRTPVTKPNAGDGIVFISMNGLGDLYYGGHWITTCCIALSYEVALLTSVGSGTNPNVTSHNVNGTTYWIGLQATNASWGGGTQIGNPLNVPVFDDLYICEVNSSPSTQRVTELIQTLGIVADYTPSSSGGSVYIGNNSSSPYKVINIFVNRLNKSKIAKGWVGVADEPRLFWGGEIIPIMTSNTTPKGVVSYSGFHGHRVSGASSSYVPDSQYFAFDGDPNTALLINQENIQGYIEYTFDTPTSFNKITITACKITMYSGRDEPFTVSINYGNEWHTYGHFTITEHNGLNYIMKDYTVSGSATNVTAIRVSNDIQKIYGYNVAIGDIQAYK